MASTSFFHPSTIPRSMLRFPLHSPISASLSYEIHNSGFTWDDVVRFSPPQHTSDSSSLQGFFEKVRLCNRNAGKINEFVPFVVEEQTVGYVHNRFAHCLRRFEDTFTFPEDTSNGLNFGYHLALHTRLSTYEDRTRAVGDAIKCLGENLYREFGTRIFLIRACSSALLWNKGLWSAYERLCRKRWREIPMGSKEK